MSNYENTYEKKTEEYQKLSMIIGSLRQYNMITFDEKQIQVFGGADDHGEAKKINFEKYDGEPTVYSKRKLYQICKADDSHVFRIKKDYPYQFLDEYKIEDFCELDDEQVKNLNNVNIYRYHQGKKYLTRGFVSPNQINNLPELKFSKRDRKDRILESMEEYMILKTFKKQKSKLGAFDDFDEW